MKKLIDYILTKLVDHPDEASTLFEESGEDINVSIKVNSEDAGKVIGKQGRTINSIRSLAKLLAIKNKKRITLRLVE